jgi:hypothetical protein
MSADKYAQFIAEQQRKLSVSGVNAVDLQEKKQMSKADIAKLREPKDDIDADDLEALRNKEHLKKEEVEALDEILDRPGKELGYALKNIRSKIKAKLTGDKDTVRKRERGEKSFKKNAAKKKDEREMDSYRNKLAGKALRDMGRKTGLGMYYDKIHKEEVEQINEDEMYKAFMQTVHTHAKTMTPKKFGKEYPSMAKHQETIAKTPRKDVHRLKVDSNGQAFMHVGVKEEVEALDEAAVPDSHKQAMIKRYGRGRVTAKNGMISHTDKYGETNSHTYDQTKKQPIGRHVGTITVQEEAEQVDEIRAIKGVHATRMQKAPSITPSKVRYKGRSSKPKVQTDLNITASYEISADESAYLEEMVGKGKLNDILMHHKDNMRHHEKMLNHHMVQADKAEEVGDDRGFDHHTGEAMHHEMQAQHHQIRFDHATGLKARANAQREMKAAQSAMKSASEKIAAAKRDKRDWG